MLSIFIILSGIIVIAVLYYLMCKSASWERKRFFETVKVGDIYHYWGYRDSDNPFEKPYEILEVKDKKDGYVLLKITETQTGETREISKSCLEFCILVEDYCLEKQPKK